MSHLSKALQRLQKKVHISWLVASFAAGLLLGAAITPALLHIETNYTLIAISLTLTASALAWGKTVALPIALAGGLSLGLWLGLNNYESYEEYSVHYGDSITLSGTVSRDINLTEDGQQQIRLDDVELESENYPGEVWLSTYAQLEVKRGDNITAAGTLSEGFGTFAAAIYRARITEVVRPEPGDVGRVARDWFALRIKESIPEPESTLGISYFTGHRQALPSDISERLRILGLSHIVVASGFHLTIVVRYLRRAISSTSKYLATFLSLVAIVGFLFVTGFSTSMTRASLVAGLSLLAWYYGRNIHPVVLLLIVAAMTIVISPQFIWGDMGWYLSFAAFTGVIILAPLINSFFFGDKEKQGAIHYTLLATTSAQITTFPIVAFAFGHYSPLALLANLVMLPLVPIAMLLTAVAGIVESISSTLGSVAGLPAYGILLYMTNITEWLASSPWAAGEVSFSLHHVVYSYTAILLLIIILRLLTGHKLKRETVV